MHAKPPPPSKSFLEALVSPFCFSLSLAMDFNFSLTILAEFASPVRSVSHAPPAPAARLSVSGFYICRFLRVALLSLSVPVRPRGDGESIFARSWTSRFTDELSIAPTSNPKRRFARSLEYVTRNTVRVQMESFAEKNYTQLLYILFVFIF